MRDRDYVWPDYLLGFPALLCRAGGSYQPLFIEVEFRRWASAYIAMYAKEHGQFCPECYQKKWFRYGRNPGGTLRLQCQY
ncbi:cytoplasmic protein, partial [Salmonella enterica subsp. enterica serovar Kentucky]